MRLSPHLTLRHTRRRERSATSTQHGASMRLKPRNSSRYLQWRGRLTDLGFTRDRESIMPKSSIADLGLAAFFVAMDPQRALLQFFEMHATQIRPPFFNCVV